MIYYYLSRIHRILVKSETLSKKTIAIGNFSFGGAGKTPFTIFLANKLKEKFKVIILSRGYKRKDKDIQLVRDKDIYVEKVGEEPYIIHLKTGLKVFVYKNRLLASKIAIDLYNPDILIYDDALQYWKINFDKKILILNHRDLRGWRVFPFGKFREPIEEIKRVDIVVINFKFEEPFEIIEFMNKPAFCMKYKILNKFDFKDVVAFCGIADSLSFKSILEKFYNVVYFKSFPDHHYYKEKDLEGLRKLKLPIITTLKDYVKVQNKENVFYLDIDIEVKDFKRLYDIIFQIPI
ncbi:MAG: tetraacyldisaccharide 4'-kinase [candidate division WOR-3 bacterium]